MSKVYGFVWHDGVICQAFETESENEIAAATIMHVIVQKYAAACENEECEHVLIVTGNLTPKMITSGMTANMQKVLTQDNKRELILRVMSALINCFTPDQLRRAWNEFPLVVKKFLNDADCLQEPDAAEIGNFYLGSNFPKEYPKIRKLFEGA